MMEVNLVVKSAVNSVVRKGHWLELEMALESVL